MAQFAPEYSPVKTENILYKGTTYVPIRAAAEILDKDVIWDTATMTATIRDKKLPVEDTPTVEIPNDTTNQQQTELTVGLTYKGKTDVLSLRSNGQLVKKINHYELDMGEGKPISIYVTDDYERTYGNGFAYEEIKEMILSIEKKRGFKPYALSSSKLDVFFYTNESDTPLPANNQASAEVGTGQFNRGNGVPVEILMNGSNMHRDHRQILVHELYHYFDHQWVLNNGETYTKYWGQDAYFWYMEGSAEYAAYSFYNYPANSKNMLRPYNITNDKESMLRYIKQQEGLKSNIKNIQLNHFGDIMLVSNSNYGVTLSLFSYLSQQFGYDKVYDYISYVGQQFSNTSTITTAQRDDAAKQHFGKTEKQILNDWLVYFDYFSSAAN
nr:stalk domain-containing protein [Paenibacillus oenotherae]